MDNPIGHTNWYAVLETKRLLLRPNTNATWITAHQIETYSTPYIYTLFATSTEHIDRYDASAYNASICECAHLHRIACKRISHASCEHSHMLFGRLPCPLCAHSQAMRAHSHRMRSHRMRMRAFKGNLCVSGTVPLRAKFVRGSKKIYLHFMLFLHIGMTPVIEILLHVR